MTKGILLCNNILRNGNSFKYGWLIKTDINGNVLWDKKFGNGIYECYILGIDKTFDGGLIISGGIASIDKMHDPMFIKLNACGEVEW